MPTVTTASLCYLLMTILLMGCQTAPKTRVIAPSPPSSFDETMPLINLEELQKQNLKPEAPANEKKSCSFSSFQRKNTLGYEWDESTHIALRVSPSFDIWQPDDIKVKTSLRLTHALGGAANKRPCTYGSGYYGLVPYLTNDGDVVSRLTNPSGLKSLVQEKIEERNQRAEERRLD